MDCRAQFIVFDTAIGTCALVGGEGGLIGVYLPSADETGLRGRISRHHPGATEGSSGPAMDEAAAGIKALFEAGEADLSTIVLDDAHIGDFERAVYAVTRAVPPGQTITYGEIAREVGEISDSRRVGQALGRNPWPIVVPCHRVLGADGKTGGFSAPGAVDTKIRMLNLERAKVGSERGLFDDLPLAVKPK